MLKWEIGLSTGIAYRQPIETVLAPLRSAGIQAIEISTAPHHLDVERSEAFEPLRDRIQALGLRVVSLHAPFGHDVNFTNSDDALRRQGLHKLACAADALQALGGRLYVIHPGDEDQRWAWEREKRLSLSVRSLTEVWERCHERGLTLVLETPLPHLLGGHPEDFAWILERLPVEGTSVCVDTSHTALGHWLFECLERFSARIGHIQVSDNRGTTDDHLPPGEGIIDWERVIATLDRIDYRGTFMLEVAGTGELGSDLARLVAAVERTLQGAGRQLPAAW